MASFVKPCSCINFHFLSHREYRKYDRGPNSFLSLRSQSPPRTEWGKGVGCRWPSQALLGLGRFGAAPKRCAKVRGLQPRGLGSLVVAQDTATRLQKAWGSREHLPRKVVFQSHLPPENKPSWFHQHDFTVISFVFLRFAGPGSLRLGRAQDTWGWVSPKKKKIDGTWRRRALFWSNPRSDV